jgi:glycosyltransferase involved in cell wall biosynthesis
MSIGYDNLSQKKFRFMKVLLIAPAPPPAGGIQSVTENLVKYIQNSRNGTNLVLCNTTHKLRPMTSEALFVRLYTGIMNSLSTYFKVLRLIKKDKPDVIHLASSSSLALIKDLLIVKAANDSKIPVVMHWHFGRIPSLRVKRNWEWRLLNYLIHRSSMSIVIDQKSYDTLKGEIPDKVVYVPNPLGMDIEQKARRLNETPFPRLPGRLIFVGHIIRDKGVFELVEACLSIPEIKELMLIGPCEESIKKDLEKIAQCRNDNKWLKFTGEVEIAQVIDYMKEASVLSLPSYTEGFPMVILEAMAMGCTTVTTNVGAIPEMLGINSKTPCGICVPPQNVEKLRDAISYLVSNPHELEVFGKRATNRVLETYTIEIVYRQYKDVWEKSVFACNAKSVVKLKS